MAELPISPVERIIRKAGAERVSGEASERLAEILEERGKQVAMSAIRYAEHADRKTVKREDIRMALEE